MKHMYLGKPVNITSLEVLTTRERSVCAKGSPSIHNTTQIKYQVIS